MASSQHEERRPLQFGLRSALLGLTAYGVLWALAATAGPGAMALLAIGTGLAIAAVVHVGTFFWISRLPKPFLWRLAAVAILVIGIPISFWIGAAFQYQVSPTIKYCGFPFPAAILVLENGLWIDYVGGLHVVLVNILLLTTILLLPVLGALLLRFLILGRGTQRA